ncbi:MAG TPA: hypothetical protein VFN52_04915, partial [Acidiferrobacteraceae bacterium]|nr:hypothetical protein [Acidiferrobacteraceae bacterium]
MQRVIWLGAVLALLGPPAIASSGHPQLADQVLGTFPVPPAGPGPGTVALWPTHGTPKVIRFAPAGTPQGNSFYAGYDPSRQRVYVPTVAGITWVLDARDGAVLQHFPSPKGGRVARVSPDHRWLLVLSGKQLASYALSTYRRAWTLPVGGNALAFTAHGRAVFVGGNMDKDITEVRLPTGHLVRHYPIARSGDLLWAGQQLFSADISSGIVSALNPTTGRIVRIQTPERDPNFSYAHIAAAKAGFMQLAASPHQRTVYIAGFSGHILRISVAGDRFTGDLRVRAPRPSRLSGIAV